MTVALCSGGRTLVIMETRLKMTSSIPHHIHSGANIDEWRQEEVKSSFLGLQIKQVMNLDSDYLVSFLLVQFSSVHSVVSNSLRPHESQHSRPPCPSPAPRVHSNSHPLSWWCHPAISSSVIPFSSCPQSLPASGSFLMSQLFAWGGQSIGVSASASVLPVNTQDWSPLGWTGLF